MIKSFHFVSVVSVMFLGSASTVFAQTCTPTEDGCVIVPVTPITSPTDPSTVYNPQFCGEGHCYPGAYIPGPVNKDGNLFNPGADYQYEVSFQAGTSATEIENAVSELKSLVGKVAKLTDVQVSAKSNRDGSTDAEIDLIFSSQDAADLFVASTRAERVRSDINPLLTSDTAELFLQ